jgi:hypothetical protein
VGAPPEAGQVVRANPQLRRRWDRHTEESAHVDLARSVDLKDDVIVEGKSAFVRRLRAEPHLVNAKVAMASDEYATVFGIGGIVLRHTVPPSPVLHDGSRSQSSISRRV